MAEMLRVLGLCGSLRAGSFNRAALDFAAAHPPEGMAIEAWDGLADIPPYDDDLRQDGFPPPVERLRRAIRDADGLLIASPEYNYSIPGVLKNAIDWASHPPDQPFRRKAIALMGASPGALGAARAQYHLRQCFVFLDGLVMNVPEVMIAQAPDRFDHGELVHDPTRSFLRDTFLPAFADWIRRHGT